MIQQFRLREDRDGFTLLEIVLALGLISLVLVVVATTLYTAINTTKSSSNWGDSSEQLRLAMNQMGEDLTFGQWHDYSPKTQGFVAGRELIIRGYQLTPTTAGWDTTWLDAGWRGWVGTVDRVYVDYALNGNQLVRSIYGTDTDQSGRLSRPYTQQVLVTGLNPPTAATNPSSLAYNLSNSTLTVNLHMTRIGTKGANADAQALAKWQLRNGYIQ